MQEAGRVGLSPAKYRSEIEKQIRIQRLVDREVRRRVVLSEAEIEERAAMLAAQDEAANVEYEVAHISLLLDDPGDQDARAPGRANSPARSPASLPMAPTSRSWRGPIRTVPRRPTAAISAGAPPTTCPTCSSPPFAASGSAKPAASSTGRRAFTWSG
ncbi:MAG: hypothetical protein M5U09_24545 [Gammaproteobacteria bacterium]|nr:hypothetical protein [Gammaproteobacteria bacterium]